MVHHAPILNPLNHIRLTAPEPPETMVNELTIDDPIAYTRPWTATMTYRLRPKDFEMGEFMCNELMLSKLPDMRPK